MSDSPHIVTPDGARRVLNLRRSPPSRLVHVRAPGHVLPDSEIRDFDAWPSAVEIKNQGSYGACNGHATATALEFSRHQGGQPHVPLSAWFVYGRLVHGNDQGSNIIQAYDLVQAEGCAPESEVKYGDFSGKYAPDVMAAARRFTLHVGDQLRTWDEVLTRVALRESMDLSICVADNFNDLDPEGAPGVGKGPGNHAVMVGGGIKTSKRWGRMVRMANSWGVKWGLKGFCWLAKAHIESGTWFEAFTVRAVVEDLADDDNPPAATIA